MMDLYAAKSSNFPPFTKSENKKQNKIYSLFSLIVKELYV